MNSTRRVVVATRETRWFTEPEVCTWPRCLSMSSEPLAIPLCEAHAAEVFRVVNCAIEAHTPEPPAVVEPAPVDEPVTPWLECSGYVYFIRFRDRIKIGWSSNPRVRIRALPSEAILAVVRGDAGRRGGVPWVIRSPSHYRRVVPDRPRPARLHRGCQTWRRSVRITSS